MFLFCDNRIKRDAFKTNKKLFGNFNTSCFDSIISIPANDWNEAVKNNNAFLTLSYLNILHKQESDSFRFRYVIVYNRKKPIGVVYFQINDFSASIFGEMISDKFNEVKSKRTSLFQKYIKHNSNETVMRLLTCGNNYISGEHGFYLNINSKKTIFKIIEAVIDNVAKAEKLRGKISAVLVKDFYEDGFANKSRWFCTNFIRFKVEPNMLVTIPNTISTLDEYIASYSKKYRNRAKGILKASSVLQKKRLAINELHLYCEDMCSLYLQVYNNAKFKLACVTKDYFLEAFGSQKDLFYVDAWFLNGKMVSFASGFYLAHELEAHYIGFDYSINKEYELYQTILYSYIEEAIKVNKKQINLGRTASEIKSTVGAKAHDLFCYIKPQNTVSRLILKPFMQFLQPTEWVPRNPFKEVE